MEKLKVMVSSVVRNLEGERDALLQLFRSEKYHFVELVGANPYDSASFSASSGTVSCRYCYIKFKSDHACLIELRLCTPISTEIIVAQEIFLEASEIIKLIT